MQQENTRRKLIMIENFWDFNAWGSINLIAVMMLALLGANVLKRRVKFIKHSLIPTSVLAGLILLIASTTYEHFMDKNLFDTFVFAGKGLNSLEFITYHALALGFIASTLASDKAKFNKKRTGEIFDTGVTTVATYLLQGIFGMAITIGFAYLVKDSIFPAAGLILPFGYGQGTGQAMNWGMIYENDYGFEGGKSFGLTIAAMGFLFASLGGVLHLNILKWTGKLKKEIGADSDEPMEQVEEKGEIPMNGTIDKMTVQVAFVLVTYIAAYLLMYALGELIPGMKSVIYGFNFLLGVLAATLVKNIMSFLRKKNIITRKYTNSFLLTHISNMCFDIMIVAGIAAIRIDVVKEYWYVILILGISGFAVTYFYNLFIAKKFFPDYSAEQFMCMYGMLTGTASTGVMLLRELDPMYKTDAKDNLIYQNFPAIVFGFPLMLLANLAPVKPELTLLILVLFFIAMNIILFRRQIFKRRVKAEKSE